MYDFSKSAINKMRLDDHGYWKQYVLEFQDYAMYIQMPNKSENTMEIFINKGKRELVREWVIKPEDFNKIQDVICSGGIYINRYENRLDKLFKRRNIYLRGINLPDDSNLTKFDKIY